MNIETTSFMFYSVAEINGKQIPIYCRFNPMTDYWFLTDNGFVSASCVSNELQRPALTQQQSAVITERDGAFITVFYSPESIYKFNNFLKEYALSINEQNRIGD